MFTVTICSMSPLVLPWLIYIMIPVLEAQEVKVTGYLGHDVTLPCQAITRPEDRIHQVRWELEQPDGKKINIIYSNSRFGVLVPELFLKERVEIKEQSLIIRDVEMRDAGSYICSVSVFPRGSFEGTTNLHVQERLSDGLTIIPGEMLILPRMIAAGVFLLIVVTMLATTYSIIIRIRRFGQKALVRHRVCTDAGGPVMCE
ncbi:nectin-4-like isoform X1 [Anarrhichthys ocellatus]|uniref:nectin-4-like isoform X1 n=1 Tax=Anarrhichthys ocellatus TaxID=433405 RepID=UPI0012EE4F4E|nr:nectin-4-like isoform X1 [Anarrhichthys ocellatus]